MVVALTTPVVVGATSGASGGSPLGSWLVAPLHLFFALGYMGPKFFYREIQNIHIIEENYLYYSVSKIDMSPATSLMGRLSLSLSHTHTHTHTHTRNLQYWKQLEEQAFHLPELQDIHSYNTIVYINE